LGSRYNLVAGKNLDRLCALSDGVFAVAMTLLVLDLHVPESRPIHTELDLWRALIPLATRLIPYLMCFLTLGIFWVGQQAQLNVLARADRTFTWIHIAFLLIVSLLPFSTALLANFITFRLALLTYWLNVLLLGTILFTAWRYAATAALIKPDVPQKLCTAIERRIILAQTLYAFGAALCAINTTWSIAFIVAIQLNYAIAPRIPILNRL